MDRRLHQRLCHLSTKQNHHPSEENPTLWNHGPYRRSTLPTDSHGSDHRTPSQKRQRRYPNNRGSRLLKSRSLLTLFNKYHGTWDRSALFGTRLSMVWSTKEDDQ